VDVGSARQKDGGQALHRRASPPQAGKPSTGGQALQSASRTADKKDGGQALHRRARVNFSLLIGAERG